jgi:hypothetical protein
VVGQLQGRLGTQAPGLPRIVVDVQRQLVAVVPVAGGFHRPLQVLQGDPLQVERSLLGVHQVGSQLHVHRDRGARPRLLSGNVRQQLEVVAHHLDVRVGQHGAQGVQVGSIGVRHAQ